MSDQFVPQEVLDGADRPGNGDGNDYTKPMMDRPVEEIVNLVDRWWKRCAENRRHVENTTLLNLAFHLGQQYVRIDPSGGTTGTRVVPVEKRRGQVRTVDNLIDPAVRQEMARLLRTRPIGDVIPQGDDPADHEAATAASDAVQHAMREGSWEEALEEAVMWSLVGGVGHIGVSYEEYLTDSFGNRGLISFRALSPFEFAVPHLRRSNLDDQPYVMVTKAYEVDEIEARWGVRVAPDRNEQYGSWDERLQAVITGTGRERQYGRNNLYDHKVPVAVVKEVWVRPGPSAPNGAVLIVASGKMLQAIDGWPEWCNGMYPFAKMGYTPTAGAYWDKAMVSDLIPIQRRHNRAASVIVEMMGLISHTAVAAPRGTKVKSILGGRGTMLETPPGMSAPTNQLQVSNVGNLPVLEMEQTRTAVRDLAFFHEVSRGTTPPNVRSGTAIAALKELDDAASTIPVRSIERATQRMGRFSLSLVKARWNEDRMVMVLGTESDVEMRSFINSRGVGGQYWVQPGSAWPLTKAQRQSMVIELYQNQLITPEEALRHMEVGTPQSIKNDRYRDVRHARRENQKYQGLSPLDENGQVTQASMDAMLAQAQSILPAEWHNHEVHLREHNNLRKSPTYESWAPWKKELFEAHISGHRVALEQQLISQMQGPGGMIRAQGEEQAAQAAGQREAARTASERIDAQREQALRAAEVQARTQQASQASGPAPPEG